jgi:hypothetical protein
VSYASAIGTHTTLVASIPANMSFFIFYSCKQLIQAAA